MKAQSAWTVVGTLTLANAVRCHKNPRKVCCCTHQPPTSANTVAVEQMVIHNGLLVAFTGCVYIDVGCTATAGRRVLNANDIIKGVPCSFPMGGLFDLDQSTANLVQTQLEQLLQVQAFVYSCKLSLITSFWTVHSSNAPVCAIFPPFFARLKATPLSFDCSLQ